MDTKIEIIEEDPLSHDVASQNETEVFTKNDTLKTNNAVLYDECDRAIKTEMKSETPFPDFCSQKERECRTKHVIKQINSETVTCKSIYDIDKKYNSDHEDCKIEVKAEPWWVKTEALSDCDDLEDGDFTSVKSPRLHTEAVSGNSYGDSPLASAEFSGKDTSFSYGKDHKSQSHVTRIPPVEKHAQSEQTGEHIHRGKIYSRALWNNKGESSHNCNICDKSFIQLSALKQHNLIHESTKRHKCLICEKSFSRLSGLRQHNLIHEDKKPYDCKICEKSFTQLSRLKQHSLIHEDKKPYNCKICERSFNKLSNLKQHNLIHECKKPHKCEICEKSFTQMSNLKVHNLIHKSKKPHKCEICKKRFTQLSDLKTHTYIHEGTEPYKCEICEKSFTRMSNLKRHNLIHECIKPHKCEICEKSFTLLSGLKRHTLIHEGKKLHKCEICEKRFTQLSGLNEHNLIHESLPHKT